MTVALALAFGLVVGGVAGAIFQARASAGSLVRIMEKLDAEGTITLSPADRVKIAKAASR